MNKNRKLAFTIAELLITTVLMAIILIIAPVMIAKKSVKQKKRPTFSNNIAECNKGNCIYNAANATLTTPNETKNCFDRNRKTGDFYTIELTGGGGSASTTANGCDGGRTTLTMISLNRNDTVTNPKHTNEPEKYKGILTGYYLLQVGSGGKNGKSGGNSIICVLNEEEGLKTGAQIKNLNCEGKPTLAIAAGGITTSEGDNCETSYAQNASPGSGGKRDGDGKGQNGKIEIK